MTNQNSIMTKIRHIRLKHIPLLYLFLLIQVSISVANDNFKTESDDRYLTGSENWHINGDIGGSGDNADIIFKSGFEALSEIPMISDFSATPVVIDNGNMTTLSWTLNNNATSCIKSGDWLGTTNPANGMYSEVVSNIASTSIYSLQCFNEFGSSQLISTTVLVNEMDTAPVVILSADPSRINEGDSVTINWTLANNAVTCIKSGDWQGLVTGDDLSNGVHSEIIDNLESDAVFNLRCSNAFGDSPIESVEVSVIPGPLDCPFDQPPILNGLEDRTIRLIPGAFGNQLGTPGNPAPYDGNYEEIVNGGGQWPGNTGGQSFATLSRDQYIAMEFTTSAENETGRLIMVTPGNGQGPPPSAVTVSISECPGDFTTHLDQDRCRVVGGGSPSLRWSQDPSTPGTTHCLLKQNTRYYLNIVHSNSVATDFFESSCGFPFCGIIFANN